MIKRALAIIMILYFAGLAWFAVFLPAPDTGSKADGIVVLTGAPGRMQRALERLQAGDGRRILVSGVDRTVKRREFEIAQHVPRKLSACCIDLGKESVDTVSNARETTAWVRRNKFRRILLVTSDWHMRRARFELERALDGEAEVIGDAIPGKPRLGLLFKEYNKYVARRLSVLLGV